MILESNEAYKSSSKLFYSIKWQDREIRVTRRQYLGWKFENKTERGLKEGGFIFERHDLGSHEKSDYLVFGQGNIRLKNPIPLECKFSNAKIFPCWVRRDWITRFSKDAEHKIVVTNCGLRLTQEAIDLLNEHGIKRVYDFQLKTYLEDLVWKQWRKEQGLGDISIGDAWLRGSNHSRVLRYKYTMFNYSCSSSTSHDNTLQGYTSYKTERCRNNLVYHPWLKRPRALSKYHFRFCNSMSLHFLSFRGLEMTLGLLLSRTFRVMTSVSSASNFFAHESSFLPAFPSLSFPNKTFFID